MEDALMNTTYLVSIPLPEEHVGLNEPLLRTAACFLEAQGGCGERIDLGMFRRDGRAGTECLTLVTFAVDGQDPDGDCARALEGVLRSTLKAAGVSAPDVRVFVADTEKDA
jgi:hypothetical protein